MGLLSQSQIIWEIQSHLMWNLTTAAVSAPRASENRLGLIRRNGGLALQRGRDYGVPMNNTSIAGVRIPDSKLAQAATELVRDTESDLLFHHSTRVYYWSFHKLGDVTAFKKRANQGRAFRHSF